MVLVTQIGGLVQTAVASTAASARDTGIVVASVAAAAIAWLIFMLPHSVVTVSVATAYFTRMSHHAASNDMAKFKIDMTTGLKVIALVSMISTAMLIVLSYPIARVFAGEYPATAALGNVVAAFMIGLVPFSFVYMMQRAFFALEDTKTPFFFTSIQIAIHITGSLILGATMDKQWLVVSIALLTAFSVSIQGIIAYLALKSRIGGLEGFGVGRSLITFFLGNDSGSAMSRGSRFELAGWHRRGKLPGGPGGNCVSERIRGWVRHAVHLLGVALVVQSSGTQRSFETIDH